MNPPLPDILQTSGYLIDEHRYDEAVAFLEHNRVNSVRLNDEYSEALILNQLGLAYARQGKSFLAGNSFNDSVILLTRTKGKDAPDLIDPLNSLANLLYDSGQSGQAEALVHRSLDILASLGPPGLSTGGELAMLARIYLGEGKLTPARESAEESLKILRRARDPEDLPASIAWSVIGVVDENEGSPGEAEEALKRSLSILQKNLDPDDYRVGEALANLGLLYANEGSLEKAEPLFQQAHESFRANALNTLFVRDFLDLWADIERKAGRKKESKRLRSEEKLLISAISEGSMSRYVVDASALRQLPPW